MPTKVLYNHINFRLTTFVGINDVQYIATLLLANCGSFKLVFDCKNQVSPLLIKLFFLWKTNYFVLHSGHSKTMSLLFSSIQHIFDITQIAPKFPLKWRCNHCYLLATIFSIYLDTVFVTITIPFLSYSCGKFFSG